MVAHQIVFETYLSSKQWHFRDMELYGEMSEKAMLP